LTTHRNTHAHPPPHHSPTPTRDEENQPVRGSARASRYMPTKLARCSRPLCSSQSTEDDPPHDTASPSTPANEQHRTVRRTGRTPRRRHPDPHPQRVVNRPAPSGPNSVPTTSTHPPPRSTPRRAVLAADKQAWPNWSAFHPRAPSRTPEPTRD